jgi:hypothetical protein
LEKVGRKNIMQGFVKVGMLYIMGSFETKIVIVKEKVLYVQWSLVVVNMELIIKKLELIVKYDKNSNESQDESQDES